MDARENAENDRSLSNSGRSTPVERGRAIKPRTGRPPRGGDARESTPVSARATAQVRSVVDEMM